MKSVSKYTAWTGFVGGVVVGLLIYQIWLWFGGYVVLGKQEQEQKQTQLTELIEENQQLTEDLFSPGVLINHSFDGGELPYDGTANALVEVSDARELAKQNKKFLMVIFGANWCQDCRTLHRSLQDQAVKQYTEELFDFVNVDVGKFNQNIEVATALGVKLTRGIPVAVFFDPEGVLIGTTNEGQLEPARRYSSKQILKFVRDVAERSSIQAPDTIN